MLLIFLKLFCISLNHRPFCIIVLVLILFLRVEHFAQYVIRDLVLL